MYYTFPGERISGRISKISQSVFYEVMTKTQWCTIIYTAWVKVGLRCQVFCFIFFWLRVFFSDPWEQGCLRLLAENAKRNLFYTQYKLKINNTVYDEISRSVCRTHIINYMLLWLYFLICFATMLILNLVDNLKHFVSAWLLDSKAVA